MIGVGGYKSGDLFLEGMGIGDDAVPVRGLPFKFLLLGDGLRRGSHLLHRDGDLRSSSDQLVLFGFSLSGLWVGDQGNDASLSSEL